MITEHLYENQETFPVFPSFMGVPVLLWHACPHVSAHVMGTAHGKGCREEEEILLPCPLIVFSVLSESSPTLWEYPCILGNRVGEGQPASVTCPHPWLWCLETTAIPRVWYQQVTIAALIWRFVPLSFYYSSFPLLSVALPLSVFLIHTNTHSKMTSIPSSFPPPGTFSSVYSPKLHFPNKVKLQLQRLCAQLFHTQYGSPASPHVVQKYCLQGTHVLGMLLRMFWGWCACRTSRVQMSQLQLTYF